MTMKESIQNVEFGYPAVEYCYYLGGSSDKNSQRRSEELSPPLLQKDPLNSFLMLKLRDRT